MDAFFAIAAILASACAVLAAAIAVTYIIGAILRRPVRARKRHRFRRRKR